MNEFITFTTITAWKSYPEIVLLLLLLIIINYIIYYPK